DRAAVECGVARRAEPGVCGAGRDGGGQEAALWCRGLVGPICEVGSIVRGLFLVAGFAGAFAVGYLLGAHRAENAVSPLFAEDGSETVASFHGGKITANELRAEYRAESPFGRQRFATVDGRRQLLD